MPAIPPPTTSVSAWIGTRSGSNSSFSTTLRTPPANIPLAFAVAATLSVCTHETCSRLDTNYISGMAKKDDEFIVILDIDRVFSDDAEEASSGEEEANS